jgi:hypothetical protein
MDFYNCRIGAWQRRFLVELFEVIVQMRGRVNFTNMARYSRLGEQTFRRHFQKGMDWVAFNLTMLRLQRHPRERLVGVFDCTFVPKSGTASYGPGQFFSSALGRQARGQEVSVLGVVATQSRRAFAVDATHTPSGLKRRSGPKRRSGQAPEYTSEYTSVDVYVEQILDLQPRLTEIGVSCWVGDGFYAKTKVFDAMAEIGSTFVTRLRSNADLRYLYTGPPTGGPGRQRRYDGKILWDDILWNDRAELERRFDEIGRLTDRPDVEVWTTSPTARASSATCAWCRCASRPPGSASCSPPPT